MESAEDEDEDMVETPESDWDVDLPEIEEEELLLVAVDVRDDAECADDVESNSGCCPR